MGRWQVMADSGHGQVAALARAVVAVACSGASAQQLVWMALGRADVLTAALCDLARASGVGSSFSADLATARLRWALLAISARSECSLGVERSAESDREWGGDGSSSDCGRD